MSEGGAWLIVRELIFGSDGFIDSRTCMDRFSCDAYGKLPGARSATLMLISAGGDDERGGLDAEASLHDGMMKVLSGWQKKKRRWEGQAADAEPVDRPTPIECRRACDAEDVAGRTWRRNNT